MNERQTAGGGSEGVGNDRATETGAMVAATEAAAGNRGGRQTSTTSGSTLIFIKSLPCKIEFTCKNLFTKLIFDLT